MDVELVAQMFKNYQSNVLFHLEGKSRMIQIHGHCILTEPATDNLREAS
jgi:hypothetical protein